MTKGDSKSGVNGICLRNLLYARCIAILGHACALLFLLSRGVEEAPGDGFLITLGTLTLITLFSFLRLTKSWQIKDAECLLQLMIDIAGLASLLYFSGGAYNPLSVYFLVLIAFGTIMMPKLYSRVVTLLCVLCFMGLAFYYEPIPLFTPASNGVFTQAVAAAWTALLLSAAILSWFGADIAASIRKALRNALAQESDAEDQHLAALAGLAAGTAEELGAPLATMSALVEELGELATERKHRDDFHLLADQLDHCRSVLDKLSRTARLTEGGEKRWVEFAGFAEATVNHWLRSRPEASADVSISGKGESPRLQADYALSQAFEYLLNNAADIAPKDIRVDVRWDNKRCYVSFADNGPGFPQEMLGTERKPFVTKKPDGMGVGLLICDATVARYGGTLELTNRDEGGACARVSLPRVDV
jgi:two-component system sensor histidine kinase RegB